MWCDIVKTDRLMVLCSTFFLWPVFITNAVFTSDSVNDSAVFSDLTYYSLYFMLLLTDVFTS